MGRIPTTTLLGTGVVVPSYVPSPCVRYAVAQALMSIT